MYIYIYILYIYTHTHTPVQALAEAAPREEILVSAVEIFHEQTFLDAHTQKSVPQRICYTTPKPLHCNREGVLLRMGCLADTDTDTDTDKDTHRM